MGRKILETPHCDAGEMNAKWRAGDADAFTAATSPTQQPAASPQPSQPSGDGQGDRCGGRPAGN